MHGVGQSVMSAALRRRRRLSARLPLYAPGLIPEAAASFADFTGWTLGAGFVQGSGEVVTSAALTATSDAECTVNMPAGDVWMLFDQQPVSEAGVARARAGAPYQNGARSNRRPGVTVEKFTFASGMTKAGVRFTSGYAGAIQHFQAVDMSLVLQNPCKIWIAAGQSLLAAQASSYPLDTQRGDGWRDPRCLYICPVDNGTFGITAGELQAACIPFQTQSGNSFGVTPAHSFQSALLPHIEEGFNLVILQCAVGGTSLIGSGAPWNPDGSTGSGAIYYNGMVAAAQAALGSLPAGSSIEGLLWSQGQADNGVNIADTYPPAFNAMLARLRADLGLPYLPCAILGPNRNSPNWDDLAAGQQTLDMDSGHINSMPGVIYVPGPQGDAYNEDDTHLTAAGSRAHGRTAAEEWKRRLHLPLLFHGATVTFGGRPVTYRR